MRMRMISRHGPAALAVLGIVTTLITTLFAACLPATGRADGSAPSGSAASAAASVEPVETGPTASPSFVRPTPTPLPTFLVYSVVRGDNLGTIAKRFGTTARSIAFWNRATYPTLDPEGTDYRPNVLQVGWTLVLIPNAVFDEQTLPEPSDLVTPSSEEPGPTDEDPAESTEP
jgi:hypothetical protein